MGGASPRMALSGALVEVTEHLAAAVAFCGQVRVMSEAAPAELGFQQPHGVDHEIGSELDELGLSSDRLSGDRHRSREHPSARNVRSQ